MYKNLIYLGVCLMGFQSCGNKSNSEDPAAVRNRAPEKPEVVIALGRVEPETRITPVGSEVNGLVEEVFFHQGDSVQQGEVVVLLEHQLEEARLMQTAAEIATQKASVEEMKQQIALAEVKRNKIQTQLDRTSKMFQSGAVTKQELDNLKSDAELALKEKEKAVLSVASSEMKLKELMARQALVREELEKKFIKAPADGIILEMDLNKGASVSAAKTLFNFAPAGPMSVLCEADELFASSVKIGQKAYIRTQGLEDTLATGTVVQTAPFLKKKSLFSDDSGNMEDRRVREVRVRIDEQSGLLINARVETVIAIR